MNKEIIAGGYHLFHEDGWLASFATNGECKDYLASLLNGRTILGHCYRDSEFSVFKGEQKMSLEINISVCIGGY